MTASMIRTRAAESPALPAETLPRIRLAATPDVPGLGTSAWPLRSYLELGPLPPAAARQARRGSGNEGGRGLLLVEGLATGWGPTGQRDRTGK
jgi:hypothetical protein